MASQQTDKIIIGIHLGTTHSRVAWTHTSSTNPGVTLTQQWPHAYSKREYLSLPSEIFYPQDSWVPVKWGYEVKEIETRQPATAGTVLKYLVLLLDPAQLSQLYPLVLEMQARIPQGKAPVDVLTDYLTCLKAHTLDVLSKYFGPEFWNVIPVRYCVAFPTVWSDVGKSLAFQAAKHAGMEDLVLMSEAEAAAVYCLTEEYNDLLKVGDTFVVVECGHGAVDTMTYQILNRHPRLQFMERGFGCSLGCGSVFLNRRFERFVRRRIGNQVVDNMIRRGKPYSSMMAQFEERLKLQFKDSSDCDLMDCPVPGVPDDEAKSIQDGYLEISRNEMKEVFDPIINKIVYLVRERIDAESRKSKQRVAAVFVVGEFAASPYLHQRLSNTITAHYGDGILVLQPLNTTSAAAHGAVTRGSQSIRVARYNYGVKCRESWEYGDPVKYKEWEDFNRIQWFVKMGDAISDTTTKISNFHCLLPLKSSLKITKELLISKSPITELEENAVHDNVHTLCTLHLDLSGLRDKLIHSTSPQGVRFYEFDFELLMKVHFVPLAFEFRYHGVTYDNVVRPVFEYHEF